MEGVLPRDFYQLKPLEHGKDSNKKAPGTEEKSSSGQKSLYKEMTNKEILWLSLLMRNTARKYEELFSKDVEKDLMPEELSHVPSFIRQEMMKHIGSQIEDFKKKIEELKSSDQYKLVKDLSKKLSPIGDIIAWGEPDLLLEVKETFAKGKVSI